LPFNWQLVLAPPDLLDYVVVHEQAHLLVPAPPARPIETRLNRSPTRSERSRRYVI
jgi:hypothetical protein